MNVDVDANTWSALSEMQTQARLNGVARPGLGRACAVAVAMVAEHPELMRALRTKLGW